MNKRILTASALTLALVMALSGCTYFDAIFGSIFKGPQVDLTDAPLNAEKLVDFTQEVDPSVLFESDGWSNGDVFNVVWKSHNVVYENGIMRLGITEESATAYLDGNEVAFNYTAGEARTQNYYHYGDYEVSMKPSANPGTASTFFVCTGPYDEKTVTDAEGNTTKVPNAHDEIDIEFLGKDTTKVQFNFFVDGQGGNEYMYDLGFDASKEFHKYGFRWTETSITWFVDGVPVYKVTTDKTATGGTNLRVVEKLPSTAGRMLTNYWCGNERAWGWMGEYKGAVNDNGTEYQWIATSAEGAPLNPPVQNPDNGENGDPVTPPAGTDDLQFEYWISNPDLYVVEGNNIKYNGLGNSYACIGTDISTIAAGKDTFTVTVTNNGEADARVRFDIQATTQVGNHTACNVSAVGGDVWTDAEWGGSIFTVAAGQTVTVAITYDENSARGAVKNLVIFVDAFRGDSATYTSDVTLSGMTFSKAGATEPSDPVDPPVDPVDPVVPVLPELPTDGEYVKFVTENAYTIVADAEYVNKVQITYSAINTNTWHNVNTYIADKAAGKTNLTLTLRNNVATTALVTVKLEAAGSVELAIQKIELAACEMETVSLDFTGVAEMLYFFIDSDWSETTTTHAGDISIAGIKFSGEATSTDPTDPVVPVLPELPTDGEYVKFAGNDTYTIVADAEYVNKVQITYSAISTNSWHNVNTYIADKAAGKSNLNVTLRNNGTAPVLVSVKLEAAGSVELAIQKIELAAGEMKTVSLDFNGVAEMLFFFIDSDWSETTTTHAGDISIAGIKFSGEAAPAAPVLPNDGEYVKLTGNDCYTITAEAEYSNTIRVSYTNVATNSYQNVNTWVQDKSTGKTSFSVTLLNNGTEAVRITVKLEKETNGPAKENTVELAAGEMKTVTLEYTEEGVMLYFFIGSGWSEATTTGSGDVTIAGIKFQ